MIPLRPLLCLTLIAVLLAGCGCGSPKPWEGITPEAYARLNEHRVVGLAQLENHRAGEAVPQFQAIHQAQPGLAFGWVNEAAALLQAGTRPQDALRAAEEGARRLPRAAWPKLVLGRAYAAAQEPEKATGALQQAVRAEPENPRILGALIKHLEGQPGDHSAPLYDLKQRLARVAPDNVAAQATWLLAQADRKEFSAAGATLDRIEQLLPRVPPDLRDLMTRARRAIGAGSQTEADVALHGLSNVLKPHPLYNPQQNLLFGNERDPADLVMREWDVPPPSLPEPPLKEIAVTWKDVTQEAGLGGVAAQGLAPAAEGDVDFAPDAGQGSATAPGRFLGRPDLVLGASPEALALNTEQGFRRPAAPAAPGSPLLLDLNNDFSLDLYAAGPSGDRVWFNPRRMKPTAAGLELDPGTGGPMTPAANPPGQGPGVPLGVDLDQDGDLDVVRPSSAPGQPGVRYLRNNGNATFTDLTASSGLQFPSKGARQAAWADFDADGDPDLFVVQAGGPSQLFLNQRQDLFKNASTAWGLRPEAGGLCAVAADFDRDGRWDLALAGRAPHGTVLYRNRGGKFEADAAALPGAAAADWLDVVDYDNDTWLDLAVAGTGGVRLVRNDHGKLVEAGAVTPDAASWVHAMDYDQDGDMDLMAACAGRLRLFRNDGGNTRPWLKVELQGLQTARETGASTAPTEGNNTYAIGAEVEPATLWDRQKILATGPQTHVGLGRAEQAVAVRVTWTNGVPDNLLAARGGSVFHYVQVPKSSCPFLYAWDGERWRFACDFNWRSPLGMLFARGAPIPHDQTLDWVKIDGEQVQPCGEYYRLVATEELREISYFDLVRFVAVDHPADTSVYVDERFKMGPPDPFRVYTARRPLTPVRASDETGRDLLPALKAVDNVYTPVPSGLFRGVCPPHDLVLDLGAVPDPSRVTLFLNGWIYPASTDSNVAAAQNPAVKVIPPTLSVGDGHGGWTEVDRNVGLPCGKRKTMVLHLDGRLVPGDHRVKLTTTMEIRWDAAFYTSGEEPVAVRQTEAPLVEAMLAERGYGTPYREVEDGPDLRDYNQPLPRGQEPDWPPIAGAYTRLGDCAPLLRAVDDRYAIVAPGDEVRLLFDRRSLPPLPTGWKRDWVLFTDGWTKDSNRNTVSGEAVGPLPFHGMKRYPYGPDEHFPNDPAHQAWQREWNTRVKGLPTGVRLRARVSSASIPCSTSVRSGQVTRTPLAPAVSA